MCATFVCSGEEREGLTIAKVMPGTAPGHSFDGVRRTTCLWSYQASFFSSTCGAAVATTGRRASRPAEAGQQPRRDVAPITQWQSQSRTSYGRLRPAPRTRVSPAPCARRVFRRTTVAACVCDFSRAFVSNVRGGPAYLRGRVAPRPASFSPVVWFPRVSPPRCCCSMHPPPPPIVTAIAICN